MVSKKPSMAPTAVLAPVETSTTGIPDERKMEQIRDILFGGLSREYDRRFQEMGERLKREVARIESDVERRLSSMDSRLESLAERSQSQLRQESSARTTALDDLDTRISQAMRTQRGELSSAIVNLEKDLATVDIRSREATAHLGVELAAALQALRETLAREHEQIHETKLGREDLADMMTEIAMRLRGALDLPEVD